MKNKKQEIGSNLLKILVCPSCKGSLASEKGRLRCRKCKRTYKIKDSVPYMLLEQ